jgi:hypothetical protein
MMRSPVAQAGHAVQEARQRDTGALARMPLSYLVGQSNSTNMLPAGGAWAASEDP